MLKNILKTILNYTHNASIFQLISALSTWPDKGVSVMNCRRAVSKNNFGEIHGSDSHLNTVFVFRVNLKWEEKARGCLSTDVWSEHCVCRKVRGQKKIN